MSEIKPKRWTLRICKYCRGAHLRNHDGCVTYSNSLFPQMTEWAGVDEVEVMPVSEHEAELTRFRRVTEEMVMRARRAFWNQGEDPGMNASMRRAIEAALFVEPAAPETTGAKPPSEESP